MADNGIATVHNGIAIAHAAGDGRTGSVRSRCPGDFGHVAKAGLSSGTNSGML